MKCKFCGCTDRKACAIPMFYTPTPQVDELLDLFGDEYPVIARQAQLAEFSTPCHWSAPNICSSPECIEKAYVEACEFVDSFLEVA